MATNGSTIANCMLSGYASANDTVRTFDLAPSSPWASTNISVWTNTSPLNITCWTPTTQPLNCSSANTNSSTGGATVNMVAGNSTLIGFDRGYNFNATWRAVQLTGYNTGTMNRLCEQQPASINASVWETGVNITTTPPITNLTCLLSGYPASGETPTVTISNTPPYWSLQQVDGDMYMDCTAS